MGSELGYPLVTLGPGGIFSKADVRVGGGGREYAKQNSGEYYHARQKNDVVEQLRGLWTVSGHVRI